jgi:hypothetical protein
MPLIHTDFAASCDASELLQNAESAGDCTATLPSGSSCTNIAFPDCADCTPTTCFDGILSPGLCAGENALMTIIEGCILVTTSVITTPFDHTTHTQVALVMLQNSFQTRKVLETAQMHFRRENRAQTRPFLGSPVFGHRALMGNSR